MAASKVTGSPSQRSPARHTMIRYAPTTKTIALVVNSNMLPQGARPAARPRSTTPVTLSRKPITVSATPIRPNCSVRASERSGAARRGLERRCRSVPTPR